MKSEYSTELLRKWIQNNLKQILEEKNIKTISVSAPNRPTTDFEVISTHKFIKILERKRLLGDEEIQDNLEDSSKLLFNNFI